ATWTAIAAQVDHVCGIQSDHSLWCWGKNDYDEAEPGGPFSVRSPSRVQIPGNWLAVATGLAHTCAVRDDNALWCWGWNASGQLGVGDAIDRPAPTRVQ